MNLFAVVVSLKRFFIEFGINDECPRVWPIPHGDIGFHGRQEPEIGITAATSLPINALLSNIEIGPLNTIEIENE